RPFLYLMRLDRPIGTWLLLLPALWSIVLAGGAMLQHLNLIILFSIGALVMRGAGCVINDLWDRNLDKQVERTQSRPLASGAVSVKQTLVFLAILLGIGLLILLQMNSLTIILGVISLGFVITYPLMKRITWWPQAFLGLTFNFGALMGWSAVTGVIELPAVLLYIGGFFWTLGYDTIYAHQDTEDDALIGIKSTARLFGKHSQKWIVGFYSICTVLFLGAITQVEPAFITILISLPAFAVLMYQVVSFKAQDQTQCLKGFKLNREFGVLFLIAILVAVMH
ncbi:MAG: 4-hydroxybenzoate octaprenyltransferase, partial [Alphaproteobacteria bacterium]|nr:4-hydroxybenzoate octaprenyltransferase [Alphaproteobacteria bacterium]